MSTTEKMLQGFNLYNKSPGAMEHHALNLLEEVKAGIDIVDPTNPFVFLLGTAATMAYSSISKQESTTRRIYPALAQTPRDLFYHMSDNDFQGLYATPARSEIKLLLNFDQIIKFAEYVNNNANQRRVVIPRNSYFNVSGVQLGIHYPIVIDILFGATNVSGISIRYDTSNANENPLSPYMDSLYAPLSSIILDYRTVTYNGNRYIELNIPVEQFVITPSYYTLDNISSFKEDIPYTGKFMYARAYCKRITDELSGEYVWDEIHTTHNVKVFDINRKTLVLEVAGGIIKAYYPDVYQNMNPVSNIRIDVYTTNGMIDVDISNISPENFTFAWGNIERVYPDVNKPYVAVMDKINDIIIYSLGKISGGGEGKSFRELKDEVIYRKTSRQVPILPSDISRALDDYGYYTTKYFDNVTDKVYVASKALPAVFRDEIQRTAFATVNDIVFDIKQNSLYDYGRRINPGGRITITPSAVYLNNAGVLEMLPSTEVEGLSTMNHELFNAKSYYFSPFYYVLDYSLPTLKIRAYDLNNPRILSRSFMSEQMNTNDDFKYSVGTYSATIAKDPDNEDTWLLTITASGTGGGDTLSCHLRKGGVLIEAISTIEGGNGTRPQYTFAIESKGLLSSEGLDINQNNRIVTNLGLLDLRTELEIVYVVEKDAAQVYQGIEGIEVELGKYLQGLWAPGRNILSVPTYLMYEENIPLLYTENIYQRDGDGNLIVDEVDGEPVLRVELDALGNQKLMGLPVVDAEGNPVYKHQIGDYVTDSMGNWMIDESAREVRIQVGIFLMNAAYKYATDLVTIQYIQGIPATVRGYLENEIVPQDLLLNERTDLFFKPKGNIGNVRVAVGGGIETFVDSLIQYNVRVYLTKVAYRNADLINKLTKVIKNIIIDYTKETTISVYALTEAIKKVAGSDVVTVDVDKFGPNKDIAIMRLVDEDTSFNVKERMVLLTGGAKTMIDDIQINFISLDI